MDPQEMKPVRMSDYEKYLLQQQAEQSPRHNDMTIDERMTEYIEWQNTDFDRDLMVDAHLEIIKLRRERDGLTAELAAARGEHVWSKMGELGLATMCLDWEIGRVFAFNTDGDMVADKETIQEVFDSLS